MQIHFCRFHSIDLIPQDVFPTIWSFFTVSELNNLRFVSCNFNDLVNSQFLKLTNEKKIFFENVKESTLKKISRGDCRKIKSLQIKISDSNFNIKILTLCSELTSLDLDSAASSVVLETHVLQTCRKLTALSLRNFDELGDIQFLKFSPQITNLNLSKCYKVKDLTCFFYLKKLKILNLENCYRIENFHVLKNCFNLMDLNLAKCSRIDNLNFLQECTSLKSLNLKKCFDLSDIEALQYCLQLEFLNLSECKRIRSLSILSFCKKLSKLKLKKCCQIKAFEILKKDCHELKSLNLKGWTWLSLIKILNDLPQSIELKVDESLQERVEHLNNQSTFLKRKDKEESFSLPSKRLRKL